MDPEGKEGLVSLCKGLMRDAVFATLVAIAAIVSASTVTTAVQASSLVAHR